jgi:FSR family fosmidomycin resistance protein-like MFS transporter
MNQFISPTNQLRQNGNLALPLSWGILHGLNDWIAGFMLAHFSWTHEQENSFTLLVIYSVLAFGGQLPLGFWLDKNRQLKSFGQASLLLLLVSVALYFIHPAAGIICTGLASAGVHVTGGSVCLLLHDNRSGPLGIFTAPGVAGLTLGSITGNIAIEWLLLPGLLALVVAALILRQGFPQWQAKPQQQESQLDMHDWIMLTILLIMCFRSFLYDVINQFSIQTYEEGLLVIGISAFAGKLIGGFLADRIGWKRWLYITLPLAFVLLQFGRDNLFMMGFGIACLQSSLPLSFMLMRRSVGYRYPATATALTLGATIAIAGLPLYLPAVSAPIHRSVAGAGWVVLGAAVVLATGWLLLMRRRWK